MKIAQPGKALIKKWEGFKQVLADGSVKAYPDPATGAKPWTIGYGSTGPDITSGTIWTKQQCEDRFEQDVNAFAVSVSKLIGLYPTTQNQFDALVSFSYNLGIGALSGSTLFAKHKAGDYRGVKDEFSKWIYANGKKMNGLISRRAEEAALYGKS